MPAIEPTDFVAEWKWDGIRVQAAHQGGEKRLFSRTGDDISGAFPDVVEALPEGVVLDGELLVMRDGEVAPFNDLQQRLNRKTVTQAMLEIASGPYPPLRHAVRGGRGSARAPVHRAPRTARGLASSDTRRARTDISDHDRFRVVGELEALWAGARETGIEGLMLKRRDSPYIAGRPKGHWYKWKRAPLTLDAVLMYAQRGSGKRSSYYSDYTFGAWRDGGERRARARAGRQVLFRLHRRGAEDSSTRFVRNHTVDSFGPVRAGRAQARVRGGLRFGASLDAGTNRASPCASRASTASAGTSRPRRPTGSRRLQAMIVE